MIYRTILKEIELSIKSRPITLISGARQVGKSTLASIFIKKGFNYVSLDNSREKQIAIDDPSLFLSLHPFPLIIDEIQKAPNLFEAIEEKVNEEKLKNEKNYGMYILTGSQIYKLMKGVSESNSGRISIIHMSPLSRSEILNTNEETFDFDLKKVNEKSRKFPLNPVDLYNLICKGFYPELYSNDLLTSSRFYSDYVETYIERDVNNVINIKDKLLFRRFMELLASLTGEELIYDNIGKIIGIDTKTVKNWISVLLSADIIHLLEPYNDSSIVKRIVKRPKLYFSDTGLAAYLARLDNPETLLRSAFAGHFVETYIINEIRKSFLNNGINNPSLYYYRDKNQNEIDLIIINGGMMNLIKCKSGIKYSLSDIKAFKCLDKCSYLKGNCGIISLTDTIYSLSNGIYVIPLSGI